MSGTAVDDYVKAVRKADLAEKGDDDVFRKIKKDLEDKGVGVADTELRKAMDEFLAAAVQHPGGDQGQERVAARLSVGVGDLVETHAVVLELVADGAALELDQAVLAEHDARTARQHRQGRAARWPVLCAY